jgi:hypothetical protein
VLPSEERRREVAALAGSPHVSYPAPARRPLPAHRRRWEGTEGGREPRLAPIRRRTSRPPPRPSAAGPPASSPRVCAAARSPAAPPATPVCRSAVQADNTRRCPELVSRCCNRRRAARAARRTYDRERAFADRADAWLPRPRTAGPDSARTTRRRSATITSPEKRRALLASKRRRKGWPRLAREPAERTSAAPVSSTADRRTPRGSQ